ncbi:MAG: ferric reductase-like transmembrane domain-containing protein [Betaproteobacteria bacterium]|nr:ferric reductase-like transmembrane domain-containing protein [Betaproteobacteria bacterium]
MKTILASLIGLVSLAWGWGAFVAGSTAGGTAPWAIRQEALYLTGLLSIALMSFAVLLAARPAWLEGPLGGMDRMYRTHKWAGILAVGFAALHWLVEMSDDVIKALVGREGRLPKEKYAGFLEVLRDLAEGMGEWAIYAVLAMLALTLWKRFSYRPWRFLHQAMPAIYLMLVFHAALLAPADYWSEPAGWLLVLLLTGGVYGSLHSLTGRIGRSRQVQGKILSIEQSAADIVAVRCRLGEGWRGHRSGQFAFITFDRAEGPHPFTIASADRGDRTVTFHIKALGDYTRSLAGRLQAGQPVTVEGPYGRFDMARRNRRAQQVWIAGGIGITPFLAWLESLQTQPADAPAADLHYCTRDRETDPFVARLEALCESLPKVCLHVHGSRQGESLTATTLAAAKGKGRAEVWFCGPQGLADALKTGLRDTRGGQFRFHQEAFEMR